MSDIIKGKCKFYSKIIPSNKCQDVASLIKWNHLNELKYYFDKKSNGCCNVPQELIKRHLFKYIEPIIPSKVDNSDFLNIDYVNSTMFIYNDKELNKNGMNKGKNNYNEIISSDLINKITSNSRGIPKLFIIVYLNDNVYVSEDPTYISYIEQNNSNNIVVKTSPGDILIMYNDSKLSRRETYNIFEPNKIKYNKYCIVLHLLYKSDSNNNQIVVYNTVDEHIKSKSIIPCGNNLKYQKSYYEYNNTLFHLVSDQTDEFSNFRWLQVMKRPRIFEIPKKSIDPALNTERGRPPTDLEDFCPNCYEILPIMNEYKKCPACLSEVTNVNLTIKNRILNIK